MQAKLKGLESLVKKHEAEKMSTTSVSRTHGNEQRRAQVNKCFAFNHKLKLHKSHKKNVWLSSRMACTHKGHNHKKVKAHGTINKLTVLRSMREIANKSSSWHDNKLNKDKDLDLTTSTPTNHNDSMVTLVNKGIKPTTKQTNKGLGNGTLPEINKHPSNKVYPNRLYHNYRHHSKLIGK